MKYISEIFALNLDCSLETSGDWHQSSINWSKLRFRDTNNEFFKEYGIEKTSNVPFHDGDFYFANTIRALLDLIIDGNFGVAGGMNNDFIDNEKYDNEVFNKVYELINHNNWNNINEFMKREYKMKWINFIRRNTNEKMAE